MSLMRSENEQVKSVCDSFLPIEVEEWEAGDYIYR